MTLTIELSPADEARLKAAASQQGVDLALYARLALGLEPPAQSPAPMTEAEWERLEEELAEGIDPTIPPLSEEALSRASIYGHRA